MRLTRLPPFDALMILMLILIIALEIILYDILMSAKSRFAYR
jgi:hypothetical protein